jgi:hypothetical protein
MLNREARLTKYQTQLVQSMFFWMIFSFLHLFFAKDIRPQSFITLLPSLSFFMTHALLLIHKKKFAEISVWVILLTTVCISYLARYNALSVDYRQLVVQDQNQKWIQGKKRVLVLDENIGVYKNAELASPFLNWSIAKEIFNSPDYYENVIKVHEGFRSDPPAIIRDKDDVLRPFLDRIPELKRQYVREDIYYVRKNTINN